MKKILILTIFATIILSSYAFAASPALYYSDLTSGPKTGGQNDKGVFVSIYGKGFGSSQGSSYVSIGGGQADNYPVWSDTKISFQLGSAAATGNIIVTTSEGASNGVPFTVRTGNIYFVDANSPNTPGSGTLSDPWRNHYSFTAVQVAGDTCYFRGGTYGNAQRDGSPMGSGANFSFQEACALGTSGNEIAYIAYPGETAIVDATGSGTATETNFVWGYDRQYYFVIAGFSCQGSTPFLMYGEHIRVVGNDCTGTASFAYAMINPFWGSRYLYIYGNKLHGCTNGNKLCHILYVGGGADDVDFGWNWIYNNNISYGPLIAVNQDNGETFQNINIHDNIIDGTPLPASDTARGIGIVWTSAATTVNIYNNVFINCGQDVAYSGAIYQISGSSNIYNNTLYNCDSLYAISVTEDAGQGLYSQTVNIKNNIIYIKSGSSADYIIISENPSTGPITVDYNCYYGNGNGPAQDTNAINANPLFVDAGTGDFHLNTGSPCINAGADVTSVAPRDKDGLTRTAGSIDLGAYEYESGQSGPLLGDVNSDNQVNIQDIQACVNHILGTQDWGARADVNGDGSVNVLDVQRIANIILGE